jgi:hypothetical protein
MKLKVGDERPISKRNFARRALRSKNGPTIDKVATNPRLQFGDETIDLKSPRQCDCALCTKARQS